MHGAVFVVPPPHQPCPRRHLPTNLQPAVANPYLPKKEVVNPYAASMAAAKKKPPGGAVVNPYGAATAAAGKAKPAGKSPVGGWPGGALCLGLFGGWGGRSSAKKARRPYSLCAYSVDRWEVSGGAKLERMTQPLLFLWCRSPCSTICHDTYGRASLCRWFPRSYSSAGEVAVDGWPMCCAEQSWPRVRLRDVPKNGFPKYGCTAVNTRGAMYSVKHESAPATAIQLAKASARDVWEQRCVLYSSSQKKKRRNR